jgi:hypothetical protein
VLRICAAALPMAAAAWITSELASGLPLHDLALRLVQVITAIGAAVIVFYASCRLLGVEELHEAANSIAGKFFRARRNK